MNIRRCRQKFLCTLKTLVGFLISIFLIFHSRGRTVFRYNNTNKVNENVEVLKSRPWYFKNGLLRPSNDYAEIPKLWPNQAKHDRILNQLMFLPKKGSQSIKKIYVEKLQSLKFRRGAQIFHALNCPVKSCEIVLSEAVADAVIFENSVTKVRDQSSSNQIWILHSLESPYFSGQAIQQTSVNWTASYRLDSDLVTPYDKWTYYDENDKVTSLKKNYAAGKTKKVAWFVSNCHSKNKRLQYAKILAKYISVDIYGTCGDKVCRKDKEKYCRDFISRHYKFYLSFENANCRDYITEKFYLNGLRLDVIPIVMGAPKADYEKVAPHNSFIHVEDFSSPKDLAEYLHYLDKNDQHYNDYFSWKGTGEFINTYFMCRLCAMLHAGRESHFYRKITHWWRNTETCTRTFWNKTSRSNIMAHLKNFKFLN